MKRTSNEGMAISCFPSLSRFGPRSKSHIPANGPAGRYDREADNQRDGDERFDEDKIEGIIGNKPRRDQRRQSKYLCYDLYHELTVFPAAGSAGSFHGFRRFAVQT